LKTTLKFKTIPIDEFPEIKSTSGWFGYHKKPRQSRQELDYITCLNQQMKIGRDKHNVKING